MLVSFSTSQTGQQLRLDCLFNPRRCSATMVALQQRGNAAFFKCLDPVEELPSANTDLLGYLRRGQLPTGGQRMANNLC
jgi:hypothetical protein